MMVKMARGSHSRSELIFQTCVPLTALPCCCSELGDLRWEASEHLVKLEQLEMASSQSNLESGVSFPGEARMQAKEQHVHLRGSRVRARTTLAM